MASILTKAALLMCIREELTLPRGAPPIECMTDLRLLDLDSLQWVQLDVLLDDILGVDLLVHLSDTSDLSVDRLYHSYVEHYVHSTYDAKGRTA